jgi:hypothetical protein
MDRDPELPLVVEYPGGEEVPAVAWPMLLRARLGRVRDSDNYRWWVLWTALAGLAASTDRQGCKADDVARKRPQQGREAAEVTPGGGGRSVPPAELKAAHAADAGKRGRGG